MPAREDWLEVVRGIRESRDPTRSPDLPRLYELAIRDGEHYLQRAFRDLPAADRADHVHDVLARNMRDLVDADNPRALFLVCLRNRVYSLFRRRRPILSEADEGGQRPPGPEVPPRVELTEALVFLLTAASPRDVAIFLAVVSGEDVEVIARAFGVSTANVHTIVSRLRRKLRMRSGGEP